MSGTRQSLSLFWNQGTKRWLWHYAQYPGYNQLLTHITTHKVIPTQEIHGVRDYSHLQGAHQPTSSAWNPPSPMFRHYEYSHRKWVHCFKPLFSCLIHNQLDTHSASWLSLNSLVSSGAGRCNTHFDREQPSTPTSLPAKVKRLCVFAFSLSQASSHLVSHGTVISITMSFFYHKTIISSLMVVWKISG